MPAQTPTLAAPQLPERARREIGLPWGRFFGALEQAATKEVTVLSLESSATDGSAAVDAEATDVSAMAGYLARLTTEGLERARIVRQQPVVGSERIRFSLAMAWMSMATDRPETGSLVLADLPTPAEVASLSAEWLAQAKVVGLAVRSVDHEWSQDADRTRYATLGFEVSGDYRAAREFVNRAVTGHAGIALLQFALKGAPGSETQPTGSALQGRIVLRVFVRETT